MKHKHAFTLIELLVVISIIALLIAILLPALGKAKEAARTIQCMSNIRQLSVAAYTFAADNDRTFGGHRNASNGGIQWAIVLSDYYGDTDDALRCPVAADPKITGGPGTPGYYNQNGTATSSWTMISQQLIDYGDGSRLYEGGYTLNAWTDGVGPHNFPEYVVDSFDDVRRPSDFLLFGEGARRSAWPLYSDPDPTPEQEVANFGIHFSRFGLDRHNERINISMLDGSGSTVPVVDLREEADFYNDWGP